MVDCYIKGSLLLSMLLQIGWLPCLRGLFHCSGINILIISCLMKVYQLLGDINLEFDDSHLKYAEETYSRELDLDTATVRIKYSVGDVEYTREHFASNPDQVIVTKISASKSGSLSFTVSLDSKLHHGSRVNGKNQIILEGSCPGKRITPKLLTVIDNPKGIQFSAVLDLQISGDRGVIHVLDDKKLRVEEADWAVLHLVASSSFEDPFTKPSDSKRDPTSESLTASNSIRNLSYSDLYAHHLDDYQNLFHRVSLQLSKSSKSILGDKTLEIKKLTPITNLNIEGSDNAFGSTADRVKSFKTDEDPSFVELLFQYGRYLLISCSRPGTQPSNLQGIWNNKIEPAWEYVPLSIVSLSVYIYIHM